MPNYISKILHNHMESSQEESKENKGVRPHLRAGQPLALSVSLSNFQREDVLLSSVNLLTLHFCKRDPVPIVDSLSHKG
jgi:hypothetical protein